MSKKINVLIVDDSALIRQMLSEIFSRTGDINVVDTARDPYDAREKIKKYNPDVITLDVEMPKMDGITFLRNLMRLRPIPVVMISSLTEKGVDITLEALELGAIDYVTKPKFDMQQGLMQYAEEICDKVRIAASARVTAITERPRRIDLESMSIQPKHSADVILSSSSPIKIKTTEKIIAIGASTGGTEAINHVIRSLPADCPGIVISQHIPAAFSAPFAARVNKHAAMTVCEATDGQQILPGHVYIAPGSHHLLVTRSGARYICQLNDGPPVNRHKPSVDVMFRSVAQNVGHNAIGVLLTGMGDDGARGLLEMKDTGAVTMIQDEKSSVVWGMPGEAWKLGAAEEQYSLDKIAKQILKKAHN